MTVTIPIPNIKLTPGSEISISEVTWQNFEAILQDLGEKRHSKIAYFNNKLEIISPLALHERPHRIIAYIVMTILEVEGRDWEDFGSTTLKLPEIAGIEPDTCFYIDHASDVRHCTNLNLENYPPPDLAIESDLTSKTRIEAYQAIGVPEVWIYTENTLTIYVFSPQGYQVTINSPTFPDFLMCEMIPLLVEKAMTEGTSQMLKQLRTILNQKRIT